MMLLVSQMQAGGPGKIRDIETEELIEDQQQVRVNVSCTTSETPLANIAANPGAGGEKHNFTILQFHNLANNFSESGS